MLNRYYADLNSGDFDAARYFEPAVEHFITFQQTSPAAINHDIHDVFPKQFQQHHFALEPGSLASEGPNQYVYVERSHYYLVAKKRLKDARVQVRVRFGPSGKLVFLHQFHLLPAEPERL